MLYWGEGYKGSVKRPANRVDFANSDPSMIRIFLEFLRQTYELSESKFRILLYCYSNQDVVNLIDYWSSVTDIPKAQFTKPFVRSDFKITGNTMPYGLVHIRYNDKKLLLEIKSLIDCYKAKYCAGGRVVNCNWL